MTGPVDCGTCDDRGCSECLTDADFGGAGGPREVRGSDLRVGDTVEVLGYLRCITALEPTVVPAKVLIESVAREHPEGLPAVFAYWDRDGKRSGMTVFLDDWIEVWR